LVVAGLVDRELAEEFAATPAVRYTSIRYTERRLEAGAVASIGSVGDSYDNALAESLIGLYKAECVRPEGPGGASTSSNLRP
jgi:transposase InsO family protein